VIAGTPPDGIRMPRAGRCLARLRIRRRSELPRITVAEKAAAASASGEEKLRTCKASCSDATPIAQIMTVPAA
jgi:hypothetical protein